MAFHGWQDNAGTFDSLLPLLPDSISVLAIDFAGHGFSSHYPNTMFYHNLSLVLDIRRIISHYKWDDKPVILMGHSLGGIISFIFSAIFPELVAGLLTLDVVKPYAPKYKDMDKLSKNIDMMLSKFLRNSKENTKYSYDEVSNRWLKATKGSLTPESVQILMKRGAKFDELSGKYALIRDPLLKLGSLQRFDENQSLELASNLQCHFLAVQYKDSPFIKTALKDSPDFIKTVSKAARSFKIVEVPGYHHGHLTHPENTAPVVIDFLNSVRPS